MMLTVSFLLENINNMSSQLNHLVPLFNTSDYHTWATQMTAYLRSMKLWHIISEQEMRPADLPSGQPATTTTAAVAA